MKIGDIVYLKSGSPPLTVASSFPDPTTGEVKVAWFSAAELRFFSMPPDLLTEQPPAPQVPLVRH